MNTRRFFSPSLALGAIVLALALPLTSLAASTADLAVQAEQMLSRTRWAQAVRIENTNTSSRYPETVYATIFEFNDTLWFYTATGTQPLKASRNRTGQYKENLLPLLRTVDRGFASFIKMPSAGQTDTADFASLKNGCVIESIFSLDELKEQGEPILQAKLLLYTSKNPKRSSSKSATGHCVLVYQTPSGMYYVDPPKIEVTGSLQKVRDWEPAEIAAEIESHYGQITIEEAFFEPFSLPMPSLAQSS